MERLIDSDKFLQDMADLYRQAGWDEREVHFSLADLRSNIGMEDVILIPRGEEDMVPVIRCKDCAYLGHWGATNFDKVDSGYLCCRTEDDEIEPTDYCSRARRRDG